MAESLRDRRILVVEDEYMLADDLGAELGARGATVVGPTGSVAGAMALIAATPHLDGAVLDMNLHGEMAFAAADALIARDVPLVLSTGYDASAIPPRFAHLIRCEKPVETAKVAHAIGRVM